MAIAKPKVLVTSLPKSGTNVLESTLAQFPGLRERKKLGLNSRMRLHPFNWLPSRSGQACLMGVTRPQSVKLAAVRSSLSRMRPGDYALGHIPYQDEFYVLLKEYGISPIFVIRDPRDVLVSSVYHALSRRKHFLHDSMAELPSHKERLTAMIEGGMTQRGEKYLGIAEKLDLVTGWMHRSDTLTIRFEDIIGPSGQGDLKAQIEAIVKIGEFLRLPVSTEQAAHIGASMFGKDSTFRKGAIGGWREEFDDELVSIFKRYAGDHLSKLGYSF